MSKKPRSKKARKPSGKRRYILYFLLVAILFGLVALGLHSYRLNQLVQERFEGKRWSVPSRVYARALELYPGRILKAAELRMELDLAGYQHSGDGLMPGHYRQRDGEFTISSHAFHHWDGEEPARDITLVVEDDKIVLLQDANSGDFLNLVRLRPVEIGSIRPANQEDRILVRLGQLPSYLPVALQLVEDRSFGGHHGIDLLGITRAAWANIKAGRVVQGGSTLTQQLVKNLFLTREKTFSRKFNEAIMALLLEWHYDKEQILEAYCNEIYLGQDGNRAIHGFGLAARFYFNKPARELSVAEAALLVAIVKGPTFYDPRRHPERAAERRNRVIKILLKDGFIDESEASTALNSPLGVRAKPSRSSSRYPAFIGLVKRQLQSDYREEDLRSEGLRIFTTLDPIVQHRAEEVVRTQVERLQAKRAKLQAATVVTKLGSAEVVAMVGSATPNYWGYNRALDMKRPVGSLLKPAIYLTALLHDYTLATPISDEKIALRQSDGQIWSPSNYDHASHGEISLTHALAHSYNQAAVRLGLELGLGSVAGTLQRLGIEGKIPPYPSIMLGALELSPMEIAQMYQTLADRGYYTPLRAVREVLNDQHQPLQHYALDTESHFDADSVYLLNEALRLALREGTGKRVAAGLPETLSLAGKTGTTDDLRDSWFAGFGAEYLAVVWVGNDENKKIGLSGGSGALPIWASMMSQLEGLLPPLPPPAHIVFKEIDAQSGLLADSGCETRYTLAFIEGSEPQEDAPCSRSAVESVVDEIKGWFQW